MKSTSTSAGASGYIWAGARGLTNLLSRSGDENSQSQRTFFPSPNDAGPGRLGEVCQEDKAPHGQRIQT